MKRFVAKEDV